MSREEDKMLMSQRIEAFYQQSGGPGNREIDRILEEHLLYGKDHGVRGRKEEIKDAFLEVFLNDRSTRPIILWLTKMRMELRNEWQAYLDALRAGNTQRADGSVMKMTDN